MKSQKHFSMLEMVVAIGIMTLLMLVAFPLAMSPGDNTMETVMRKISTLFEAARTTASMTGSSVSVTVNLNTRKISASGVTGKSASNDASAYQGESVKEMTIAMRKAMMAELQEIELPEMFVLKLDAEEGQHPFSKKFIPENQDEVIVTFRPDGVAVMPRIRIERDHNEVRTLEVLPLTGRIQIEDLSR